MGATSMLMERQSPGVVDEEVRSVQTLQGRTFLVGAETHSRLHVSHIRHHWGRYDMQDTVIYHIDRKHEISTAALACPAAIFVCESRTL